jgi:Ca2+-transporting ATPase
MTRDDGDVVTVVSAPPSGPSSTGLSSAEAARRLAHDGPNEVIAARRIPVWARVAKQLRDPLILVLLAAAVLTVATGDLPDATIILLVVAVNTTVGVAQELRAEHAVAALSALTAPHARVRRDGEPI